MKIKINIPLEKNALPYQNNLKIKPIFKGGRFLYNNVYKTKKLKDYQEHISWTARSTANAVNWEILPKWFKIDLCFVFKDKRHGDLDNCEKALMDALEGTIFLNDKWCKDKHVWYDYGKEASISMIIEEVML